MAVYHLKMSVGSRSGGQSAVAKADYIEREGRYEQDREELEHRESGNMPEWAEEDPRSYWEAADEYERANGRLYREVQFALPKELNEGQRRELASGFAKRLTEGERLPYTLAIHRGDGENPHAHLMFSERSNDGTRRSREQWFRRANRSEPEKGGARKSRVAVPQAWLEQTREAWAREANEALEHAGREERVDHRSLASLRDEAERSGDLERAAELSREPNVHLGPEAYRAGDLEQAGRGEAAAGGKPEASRVLERAERVEKDNEALIEERDGLIDRIKERIAGRSIGSFKGFWRRYEWRESGSRSEKRSGTGSGSMGEGTRETRPGGPPKSHGNTPTRRDRKSAMRPVRLSPPTNTNVTETGGQAGNGRHPPDAQRSAGPLWLRRSSCKKRFFPVTGN